MSDQTSWMRWFHKCTKEPLSHVRTEHMFVIWAASELQVRFLAGEAGLPTPVLITYHQSFFFFTADHAGATPMCTQQTHKVVATTLLQRRPTSLPRRDVAATL